MVEEGGHAARVAGRERSGKRGRDFKSDSTAEEQYDAKKMGRSLAPSCCCTRL
jgi:hypothetical protein